MEINQIVSIIRSARLDMSNEKAAQEQLATILTIAGIEFHREFRLSPADIVDFLVDGIAVELKMRGAQKKAIFRQLQRYAKHPEVRAILLVAGISMGLPNQVEGKDAFVINLGEAWL